MACRGALGPAARCKCVCAGASHGTARQLKLWEKSEPAEAPALEEAIS